MLASSVQSVVACNVTAPRVCTLVLFITFVLPCVSVTEFTCTCTRVYTCNMHGMHLTSTACLDNESVLDVTVNKHYVCLCLLSPTNGGGGVLIGTASVRSVILPPRMEAANDWVDLTLTNQIIGFIVSMV